MNTVLMWIGGLLAAVLAALFAVPYFVDWNGYRGVFEEEASRILGRDVRVGGKINVRLLPMPYLSFEKLRIADTRLGASEPLFRAESFTVWLSVPPLLQGNLEARHVALQKPEVALAIDKDGTGNWTTLGIRPGTLPFVPQNVALQVVDIDDGTVVLQHPRVGEVGRASNISGVISAEALDGPYKFAGDVTLAGAAREVHLVSAKADPDGTVRFKATAGPKGETGPVYKLEGSLTGFSERPRIMGTVSATVPLPELPAAPVKASQDAAGKAASGAVFADVKGQLDANADQLEIRDLVASIENVGQPQLLNGGLTLDWGRERRLDFRFTSRWLDFDRLAGAKGRASPLGTATTLIKGLTRALPVHSATRGVVSVDQLTVGGAPLANLDLAVSRVGTGVLRIERMFAELPAGARMAVEGVLAREGADGNDVGFDGNVTVAGPSLARFAGWGLAGHELAKATPDGAFALDGRLTAERKVLALKDASVTFADHALRGSAVLNETGALNIDVEAETFETDWLWTGGLTRSAVMAWADQVIDRVDAAFAAAPAAKAENEEKTQSAAEAGSRGFALRLKTNVLRGPDRALRDVVAELNASRGEVRVERLAFLAGDGFDVDISGALKRSNGVVSGSFEGSVSADTAKAVETGIAVFEIPGGKRTARLAETAPLRLAGRLALGQRTPASADLAVDGTALGGRINVRARLDGGLSDDWRDRRTELTISSEESAPRQLLDLVFDRRDVAGRAAAADSGMRASVAMKAVGVPKHGMVMDAALSREGLSLSYNGKAVFDADGVPALSGALEVAADRLGDVMRLVGVRAGGGGTNSPVTGTVGLSFTEDGRTKLTPSELTVAGSEVSGALWVARGEGGRLKLDGEVAVDRSSVSALVAGLVESAPRPVPVSAADLAFQEAQGLWTDQPFAEAAFSRFDGQVTLALKHLGLAPGLALSNARLGLKFADGVVDVTIDDGAMLGGKLSGTIVMAKAPAGARVKAELEATGVELQALARSVASARPASGGASLSLAFSGQALSPRSLITALRGSGRVTFKDAVIGGMSPDAVAQVIAAGFAKEIEIDAQTLESEVLKRLTAGQLRIGSRDVALSVGDGVLQVASFETRSDKGRTETLSTVDLSTLQSETEWRLNAAAEDAGKPAWPPVSVIYTGALGGLAGVMPRVTLGGFERELTVRRMEREVEELERLRKLDEERARQERERQKALAEAARQERERAKALEEERLRQQQLQQQQQQLQEQQPIQPSPDGGQPRTDAQPVAPAAGGGRDADQHSGAVPAPPGTPAGAAAGGVGAVGSELAPTSATLPEPGAAGSADPPVSPPADAAAPSARPQGDISRARRPERRTPSAGDTLMRSLNPGGF